MCSCTQVVRINTKIKDADKIKELGQEVLEFADKHDVEFMCGYDSFNRLTARYRAEGKTSAYCKGVIAEIKQLLKDTYNCKIEVLMYMY